MDEEVRAGIDPIYGPGRVLVCVRNQNTLAIIDWHDKKLLWAWGPGELQRPHHATLLQNGHILVFDNGVRRKHSRVLEIDPIAREIVWSYEAGDEFFSAARGSNQRLPNGNTLIAESDRGRAFEVTPEGEIVWEFRTPQHDERGHRATIIRMDRYPEDFVEHLPKASPAAQ
jgi:hypothetical protein